MATETVVWVDPDSTSFTLGDPTASPRRSVRSLVGVGAAEHDHFVQTFPMLAGNFRVGGRDLPRVLTLDVVHVVADRDTTWTRRDDLAEMFNPARGISKLQVTRSNGDTFEIQGYAWARPDMKLDSSLGTLGVGVVVQFWCPWPYWYDPNAYNVSTNADGLVTATLTLSGTSTVTTSLAYGTAANGFVTGYPHTFTITGQATNVDIWIGTTASMNFNSTAGYTIASGNTVNVYGPPFNQPRALLNDTTRVDGYVDKTDTTWAFPIPLGGGTLSAKGGAAGDDGVVTVVYRQYRRGI